MRFLFEGTMNRQAERTKYNNQPTSLNHIFQRAKKESLRNNALYTAHVTPLLCYTFVGIGNRY